MGKWKVLIPVDATNLCKNPSSEIGATPPARWGTGGTNAISTSTTKQFLGKNSFECNYQDDTNFFTYTITLPNAGTYYLTCWVRLESGSYDGGNIFIDAQGFTGQTEVIKSSWIVGDTDRWVRLSTELTVTSDLIGSFVLKGTGTTPTVADRIYMDAAMIVESDVDISYVDGDQPGCIWLATPHDSTSFRPVSSREGGQIADLEDDLGFYVQQMGGMGMPPVRNIARSRGQVDGAEFERSLAGTRLFRLVSRVTGSSLTDYHSKRQDFINAVRPDAASGHQPIVFQYEGADVTKQIKARYDSGLELSKAGGFSELAAMQFISHEPYFYNIGGFNIATAVSLASTLNLCARKVDGDWDAWDVSGTGIATIVNRVLLGPDNKVYVAGDFEDWDGVTRRNYIARWNKEDQAWETVGAIDDINGEIQSMVNGPNNLIYIGGVFTNAGGVGAADYLATLDPSTDTWGAVGTPVGATVTSVNAIAFGNGKVYVGGNFTNWAGGANNDHFAQWNGTSWSTLGTPGANPTIRDIKVAPNQEVWIAGTFTNFGGVALADYIAYFDVIAGADWVGPNSPIGADISRLLIDPLNSDVYAFGDFTQANGVLGFNKAAKYNGTLWEKMPGMNSTTGYIYDAIWLPDGRILAGGDVPLEGNVWEVLYIWNGSSWRAANISSGVDGSANITVTSILEDNSNWYIGIAEDGISTDHSGVTTITNSGNAKTYPVIEFETWDSGIFPIFLFGVVNETTGARLYFDYQLIDREVLTIDLRPGSRGAHSSVFGDVWPFLPGSNLVDFYLRPGDNIIASWLAIVSGSPTLTGRISFVENYWSVD